MTCLQAGERAQHTLRNEHFSLMVFAKASLLLLIKLGEGFTLQKRASVTS